MCKGRKNPQGFIDGPVYLSHFTIKINEIIMKKSNWYVFVQFKKHLKITPRTHIKDHTGTKTPIDSQMEMNFTKVVPVQAAEDKGGSSSGNDLKLTLRPAPKVFFGK